MDEPSEDRRFGETSRSKTDEQKRACARMETESRHSAEIPIINPATAILQFLLP